MHASQRDALHKPDWLPAFFTAPLGGETDGDFIAGFAEEYCAVTKGRNAGLDLSFMPWQRWLLDSLYERVDGRLRYRRALIGLPRKNGKSLMGSAIALYALFAGEPGAEVYSAAGDRQQARIVFGETRAQIMNNPLLAAECRVYRDAIEVPQFGSVYRVLSSDGKLAQGLNPSTVIFDEAHVQPNSELWDALTLGSGARIEPLTIAITTAGWDLESLCGQLFQYGKRCAAGEIDDPTFGFFWWQADDDCDVHDETQWLKANPNLACGLLELDDMKSAVKQSSEMAFRRYRLNQWVRAQESWLPPGAWEGCTDPTVGLEPGYDTFVGVDMALKHDSIAVVVAQPRDGRIVVRAKIWHPDAHAMDVAAVEAYLRELHLAFNVREFAYDPAFFQRTAEVLADDGLPMVEFPQSAQRMVPAIGTLYESIVGQVLAHDGDPMFTDQVLSAVPRQTDAGLRLSKGKSKRKIDAAIACAIAVDRATRREEVAPVPGFFVV